MEAVDDVEEVRFLGTGPTITRAVRELSERSRLRRRV
jgi:hypothetical protein